MREPQANKKDLSNFLRFDKSLLTLPKLIDLFLLLSEYLKSMYSFSINIRLKFKFLMPFIQINISSKSIIEDHLLQKEISQKIAELTCKPEDYVMTMVQKNSEMTFAGSSEPCCFVKLKSIGSLHPSIMSKSICDLIASKTNIKTSRIYIEFSDVNASNWGFDNSTFG